MPILTLEANTCKCSHVFAIKCILIGKLKGKFPGPAAYYFPGPSLQAPYAYIRSARRHRPPKRLHT